MKKNAKKLTLNRDTIALLQIRDVEQVRGGTWISYIAACESNEFLPEPSLCHKAC